MSEGSQTANESPPLELAAEKPAAETKKPSLLSTIVSGKQTQPPRIVAYGVHGIGKSTLAAMAPKPIFICTEEGANEIDVAKFPVVATRNDVMDILRVLWKEKHDYETVVLDSVDWLEDFIFAELLKEFTDKELSYGREALYAEGKLNDVLGAFNMLRARKQMATIVIAHSEIKRFDSPLTEPFDRYQPKLSNRVSALLQEWADAVLFATFDVTVQKEDVGFNRSVRRGVSSGERIVYTEERPAYYAKNRYGMPPELPLKWDAIAEHIPYYQVSKK